MTIIENLQHWFAAYAQAASGCSSSEQRVERCPRREAMTAFMQCRNSATSRPGAGLPRERRHLANHLGAPTRRETMAAFMHYRDTAIIRPGAGSYAGVTITPIV